MRKLLVVIIKSTLNEIYVEELFLLFWFYLDSQSLRTVAKEDLSASPHPAFLLMRGRR